MKKQSDAFPMIGGSSLLVIFAVLCLTIFALLSLSTAQAGSRLSQKSAETTYAYYAADTQAEMILSRLRSGSIPDNVTVDGSLYSYTCPISDTQELQVSVEVLPDGSYSILRWQSVATSQWQADESIDLWDGNE